MKLRISNRMAGSESLTTLHNLNLVVLPLIENIDGLHSKCLPHEILTSNPFGFI